MPPGAGLRLGWQLLPVLLENLLLKTCSVIQAEQQKITSRATVADGVCLQDWSVPQAWFLHFYLLGCCCNAAVLLSYVITVDAAAWTPKMVGACTG